MENQEQDDVVIILDEETTPEEVQTKPTEVVVESDDVRRAREAGWKPKEEYSGDVSKWVDAGEFLRRGELYDRIHVQSKELKEMRAVVDKLVAHNKQLDQAKAEERVSQLKAAKQMALEDGNTAAIVELDDQILQAREALRDAKTATKQEIANDIPAEYYAFAEANPWYMKDRAMTAFADAYGKELAEQGHSPSQIYSLVAKEVRKEFAHKFAPKPAAQTVESAKGSVNSAKSIKFTPTAEERAVAEMFARNGVMTKDQYYKQLAKTRN